MEAHAGNIVKKRFMPFAFERTPGISLSCKRVPFQYIENRYGPSCSKGG